MKVRGIKVEVVIDKRKKDNVGFKYVDNTIFVYSSTKLENRWLIEVIDKNFELITTPKIKKELKDIIEYNSKLVDDGCIYIFEKKYDLIFIKKNKEELIVKDNYIYVYCSSISKFEKVIKQFIQNQLKSIIENSITYYSELLGVKRPTYDFKDRKRAYAVCITKQKHLEFGYKIISLRKELIDYIVAHEVCHLVHANHSKDFYNLLSKVNNNSDKYKKELKKIFISLEK